MFSGVTMVCFAASYGVAWALEISRLLLRVPVRTAIMLGFALAGIVAHGIYLYGLAADEIRSGLGVFSSWYDWCVLASAVLAVAYVAMALRRPANAFGLFILPLVLGLLLVAQLVCQYSSFSPGTSRFLVAVHARNLAARRDGGGHARLCHGHYVSGAVVSLEAQTSPQAGIAASKSRVAAALQYRGSLDIRGFNCPGRHFGVVLNLSRGDAGFLWTDPVVVTSSLLFVWLLLVIIFESFYRPARQGRKVAYLTMASFIFLGLALLLVLFSRHGTEQSVLASKQGRHVAVEGGAKLAEQREAT
jgi:hypothetical protein